MKESHKIKLMVIENFIDHITTDEKEREKMKQTASTYVEEDHVDEISQSKFGTILQCIANDAEMAISGDWNKSNSGFEDQIDLISTVDIHPE